MKDMFIENCKSFAGYCRKNIEQLSFLFVSIETYKTANDEIEKGIQALLEIDKQAQYFTRNDLDACSVYLPQNQPFYSTILFAIIPSFFCKTVNVRPPVVARTAFLQFEKIVNKFFPNIKFHYDSRRDFLKRYTQNSNVVIYTGRHENASEILQDISDRTLFIYNGGGCSPIVITNTCNVNDSIITKVVNAQLYNSGQDCMAPSAILVHSNKYNEFLFSIIEKIKNKRIGSNDDKKTDVGPLLDMIDLNKIRGLIDGAKIVYGAQLDIENNIVFPTVLTYDNLMDLPQRELYMPIFCIFKYNNSRQITEYLSTEWAIANSTYISIFGDGDLDFNCGRYIIIKNDVLDSMDNGYTEFGGYGINSSYYSIDGLKHAQPILISREISKYAK